MASWPSWLRYRGKYCESGNGGDIIHPDPVTPMSLSECQQACEAHSSCEGIVVQNFPTVQDDEIGYSGRCVKMANLNVSECRASGPTDVLFARSGGVLFVLICGFIEGLGVNLMVFKEFTPTQ